MPYRRRSGGTKDFVHTKEDSARVESEDTESTKEFKKDYNEWRNKKSSWQYKKENKNKSHHKSRKKRKHSKKRKKHFYEVDEEHKREHVGSRPSSWTEIKIKSQDSKEAQKAPRSKKISIKKKNVFIVCLILILLFILLLYTITSMTTIQVMQNITKTKETTSEVPVEISFSKYLDKVSSFDGTNVTLNGFLKRQKEGAGHIYLIVDDYDNQIKLKGKYPKLKEYLPEIGKSKQMYTIKGEFEKDYENLNLNVEGVSKYTRPKPKKIIEETTYIEEIIINRTMPKYPLIRSFVYRIIGKEVECEDDTKHNTCSKTKPLFCYNFQLKENPKECGCPSGERLYEDKCIKEIKCSDGTFGPECSINKPKQCVEGKLIDNPKICGCPEDHKFKKEKCVSIRCSDGTIEPDCSKKSKMQCVEGELIFNANKCGCPEDYIKRGNNCVKTCEDGTAYGECSDEKPKYCDDGRIVNKASECGCNNNYYPSGDTCTEKTALIELKILEYTNYERENNGLSKLKWNNKIAEIARAHSEDMVNNDYFSHVNLNGEDPSARAKRSGFTQTKQLGGGWYTEGIAENIGQMPTGNVMGAGYVSDDPESIAKAQVDSWMSSPGHRENILNAQYSDLGVGVAYDSLYYISTQNFW